MSAFDIIAKRLTDEGKIIDIKPTGVLALLEQLGSTDKDVGEVSSQLARQLGNELNLIRGKIIPFFKEVSDVLHTKVLEYKPKSELATLNIVELDLPLVIDQLSSFKILPDFKYDAVLTTSGFTIPAPSKDMIRSNFKHPVNVVANYVEEILAKYSDEELLSIWDKYFTNVGIANSNISSLSDTKDINKTILIYCATAYLIENVPNGTGADEATTKKLLTTYSRYMLNLINRSIETFKRHETVGNLILDLDGNNAYVLGSLYRKLVPDTLTPEVILGAIVYFRNKEANSIIDFKVKTMTEKASVYKDEWERAIKLERLASKSNDYFRYKNVYDIALGDIYKSIPEDLKEYLTYDNVNEARTALDKKIKGLELSEIINVDYMAREIVAHILFDDTNFHSFTDNMIEYKKLDNTLTQEEAASLASIDLLTEYMMQQFDIKSY